MLRDLHSNYNVNMSSEGAALRIADASYPAIFNSGLEYASPARGHWNIVHIGLLVPETHLIYVCADSCLRGVVLTAAEMGAQDRFSTIAIRENNVLDGDNEDMIVEGVGDIINKLPYKPKAFMVYTSCVQTFIGCDLKHTFKTLRETYPDFRFIDGYMYPIMRKTSMPPIPQTRISMYSLLEKRPLDEKKINIIGNNIKTILSERLTSYLAKSGYSIKEIHDCRSWDEFQDMSSAKLNLVLNPSAVPAANVLREKLGQESIYLPYAYSYSEIAENYNKLFKKLSIGEFSFEQEIDECEEALMKAKKQIGTAKIAIDYTGVNRPFSLAKLLIEHGFNVARIYVDNVIADDKTDFEALKKSNPELEIYSTVNPKMRFLHDEEGACDWLAIGQEAAYFLGTSHFIDMVEGGGHYGFIGIRSIAELMADAFENEKDTKSLIQKKGWGCGICI